MGRTSIAEAEARWIVRLRPAVGRTVSDILQVPLSVDVWERGADDLVAAVPESTLRELERRRLATVERICTAAEYEARAKGSTGTGAQGESR